MESWKSDFSGILHIISNETEMRET